MKMRIPPRMPPKMTMMSRWTSILASFHFLFGTWWQRGSENAIYVLIWACVAFVSNLCHFHFVLKLSWSFVRTMWCEILCNVCYSVLSCRTWAFSKEFLLVCDIFELWTICFLFFCVLDQKGRILRATGRILRRSWPESSDLYPESPGSAVEHLFSWVNNMSPASHIFFALTCSPHCKTYKSFCGSLDIYMPIVDISSQNWNSKIMAYI